MESRVYHAHFYSDEPEYETMLDAINASKKSARLAAARPISSAITGRKVLNLDYTNTSMLLALDNGSQLHLFLSGTLVLFELIAPRKAMHFPSDQQSHPTESVLLIDGLTEPSAWNIRNIQERIVGTVVSLFGAHQSSVYLDIGNTVALMVSRMFVAEYGFDILFFDFDVDRPLFYPSS